MLLKYLSEDKPKLTICALFLIATPLWGKRGWDVEDFVLQENFEMELNKIRNVFLYHCKEDAIVPFEHLSFYKDALPNATIRTLNGTDHAFAGGIIEIVNDINSIKQY